MYGRYVSPHILGENFFHAQHATQTEPTGTYVSCQSDQEWVLVSQLAMLAPRVIIA
jgi:hypothetical protein